MTRRSGIYQIINTLTGDSYIGQSVDLTTRWSSHLFDLRRGTHCNPHLNNAVKRDELTNFKFEILLYCEPFELTRYEQEIFQRLHPRYNIRPSVESNRGMRFSDDHRRKISEALRGRKRPLEFRQKMSIINRSTPHSLMSQVTREKISLAHQGRKLSDITRQHMSEAAKRRCLRVKNSQQDFIESSG